MYKLWLSLLCRGRFEWWRILSTHAKGIEYVFSQDFWDTPLYSRLPDEIRLGLKFPNEKLLSNVNHWLESSSQHWYIHYDSDYYPHSLRHLAEPPLLLFGMGAQESLHDPAMLAVIGSRKASVQGLLSTDMVVKDLVRLGFSLVSGLALGIDGAAHRAAYHVKGVSVAVLGSSCDKIYPKEHQSLVADILNTRGAVISEYPFGTEPVAYHFPQRNRIVSALSCGVLVVEAARKSGAMITVNEGLKLGKDIFVMPSGVHNPHAKGGLWLIQQGAKCVVDAKDIAEDFVDVLVKKKQLHKDLNSMNVSNAGSSLRCHLQGHSKDHVLRSILSLLSAGPLCQTDLVGKIDESEDMIMITLARLLSTGQIILDTSCYGKECYVLAQ